MKQLTIRGFDEQLERRLRELARDRGISLNRAALELMRRGAGQSDRRDSTDRVGASLDTFIGVWSDEDEAELRQALEPLEQIDPELWS
jgi:hypothetical protein